jgi:hypothetical protein
LTQRCEGELGDQVAADPIELETRYAGCRQCGGEHRPELRQTATMPLGGDAYAAEAHAPRLRFATDHVARAGKRGAIVLGRTARSGFRRNPSDTFGPANKRGGIDVAFRRPSQLFGVRETTTLLLATRRVVATAGAIYARESNATVLPRSHGTRDTEARDHEHDRQRCDEDASQTMSQERAWSQIDHCF